jgi:hypothetical protein
VYFSYNTEDEVSNKDFLETSGMEKEYDNYFKI